MGLKSNLNSNHNTPLYYATFRVLLLYYTIEDLTNTTPEVLPHTNHQSSHSLESKAAAKQKLHYIINNNHALHLTLLKMELCCSYT